MKDRFRAMIALARSGLRASQARIAGIVALPFSSSPMSMSTRPIGV
jgi:hypothetical protein